MNRFLIVLCLSLFSLPVLAEFKVATVDMERIIGQSSEFKQARGSLDEKVLAAKKKVEARKASLKAMEEKLKKAKVKEGDKEAEQFRTEYREFTRMVKDTDEELRKESLKTYKSVSDKAIKLVRTYAGANQISMVLDKSENMRGPVLFGAASFDITDEVIKQVK